MQSKCESHGLSMNFLIAPAVILAAIYLYYFGLYRSYFPFGDDPAVLHASAKLSRTWMIDGFSHYFIIYPEWNKSLSDFLRPGVNLIMWAQESSFGAHYGLYFASYFAAQLLICALVILIAREFGIKTKWLYILGVLFTLNPAFIGEGLVSISFAFDVWCGLFVVLAFYLSLRERYALCFGCLLMAVFTKEAALFAPIACALAVYLKTRKKMLSSIMFLPLLIWAFVWKFVFIGHRGGIYVFQGHVSLLRNIGKGLLVWPTGLFDVQSIREIASHHSLAHNVPDILILALNILLWFMLVRLAFRADSNIAILGIWTCGALSFGVLVGQEGRLGGSIYPLSLILCVYACSRSTKKQVSLAVVALIGTSFLWNAQAQDLFRSRDLSQSERMYKLIHALPDNKTIYVIDSPESFSSPENIAAFAGISSKIIVLDQASGCQTGVYASPSITREGKSLHIVSTIPRCGDYKFNGVSPHLLSQSFRKPVRRGDFASYRFPDGKILDRGIYDPSAISSLELGKQMDMTFIPEESSSLLYYDWSTGDFKELNAPPV